MVLLAQDQLLRVEPHEYLARGAPYGNTSPWMVRKGVLEAVLRAQERLQADRAGWRFKIFDGNRPVAVQRFMVWQEFLQQAMRRGISLEGYTSTDELERHAPHRYQELAATVFTFWSIPSDDEYFGFERT